MTSERPVLEVVSPGAYATIQDLGRRGFRRHGVPWSGALDSRLLRIANALAGCPETAPVIEAFDGGLHLTAREGLVRLAVAGRVEMERLGPDGARTERPWETLTLLPGESLRIRRMVGGRLAMVAVAGLSCPQVLGSAATYGRAGLGGWDGGPLRGGQRWPLAPAGGKSGPALRMLRTPQRLTDPIRVVFGPQDDYFPAETLASFLAQPYRIGQDADRMGIRLAGPLLRHRGATEMLSDAIVPGAIQVPGNGQPVVLLADAQTAGGYPKIATVIGADLARLADLPVGSPVRFGAVSVEAAVSLAREAEAETQALLAAIRGETDGGWDEPALYAANLVGGVVDALRPGSEEG